jgi:hypothetical protein
MTKQNDDICPEAKELADKALNLSKGQLARAIQDLINTAAEQTAGNLFRSEAQVRELTRQIEHYHGKWGKHDD